MKRMWIWAVIAACHGSAPTGKRIQITYDVDLDKAVDDRASDVKRALEAQFVDEKIDARVALAPTGVKVVPHDAAQRAELAALIATTYGSTLAPLDCAADPAAICFAIAETGAIKKAALEREAATVRARIVASNVSDVKVTTQGDQLVVDLPEMDAAQLAALRDVVARTAALAFKVVDNDAAYMKQLFSRAGTDPDATAAEIRAEIDQWRLEDGGATLRDYYLTAPDHGKATGRAAIESYIHALANKDLSFALPDDRQLAYERVEPGPDAKDRRPYWRSYYVERAAALTGASIANATAITDPGPGVMLEFDKAGAHAFGDLTTRITGRKLAVILDGTVRNAPIINAPIRGGRASIALAANAPASAAAELALVLKLGALPVPLVEASLKSP